MPDATTPAWKRALDELTFNELRAYPRDERGMSILVRDLVGSQFRHAADEGRWYVYDGQRWKADDRQHRLVQMYLHLVGDAVARAGREREAVTGAEEDERAAQQEKTERKMVVEFNRQFASYAKVRSILGMMAGDVRYRVERDELDRDPYLVNFRNGTYDVRTGKLRDHEPADLVTKVVDCALDLELAHDPEAVVRWRDTLLRLADGDLALALALERALAYGLLGHNPEQRIFFLVGASGIGKSKCLEIVADLFEDYATRASVDLLLQQPNGRHDAVLAKLVDAHFAIISETEERQRVDLPQLKDLTGANKVTARYLNQQQFDARVTWTIYVSTNDPPQVNDADAAMMRRLVIVQLSEQRRDDREVDLDHATKVTQEEGEAVVARLMVRLHEWWLDYVRSSADRRARTTGLLEHPSFVAAADQYQRANDSVADFLEARLDVDGEVDDDTVTIFTAYRQFCRDAGHEDLGKIKFWRRLRALTGCVNAHGRASGVKLRGLRWE